MGEHEKNRKMQSFLKIYVIDKKTALKIDFTQILNFEIAPECVKFANKWKTQGYAKEV